MQIAGYSFQNPTRHVYLHLYNPSANHDKVYHIVSNKNSEGLCQVSVMWGRRGSSLRYMVKTKDSFNKEAYVSEYSARAMFNKLLDMQVRSGYEVQKDESFTPGAPILPEIEIENENMPIWSARSYAENPVRATQVNYDFDIHGYGIVLLPKGKRVLTLVEKNTKKFFDQHGAEITVEQELFNAVYDLDGNTIIDGIWDGEHYMVFDMPSEHEYLDRVNALAEYIDGTVDDNVVKMAHIFMTTSVAKEVVATAREQGAQTILGIHMSGGERPGQNDKSRITLSLRPRAVLCVMSVDDTYKTLGVDDGLGIIKVCQMYIEDDLKIGDCVQVEYDSWSGYGTELHNPVYVKKVDAFTECLVDQLLVM